MSEVFLTREEIEHPYANLTVMLEDKRKKAEQMRQTVFARITSSPEVLANNLVYYLPEIGKYTSEIIPDFYKERAEALAATVKMLMEVAE